MSVVIIGDSQSTKVQCGDDLFSLYKGDNGSLCIEAVNCRTLEVSVSDDDEEQVDVRGVWVDVSITAKEEEN